ncbi:MAG: DNA polymerase IV [Lachnospiraceae bacterium]|nr:DNA polymerase IV [Lachnospiraceae bacterium]
MSARAILHSDLNCFYASVEMMLDPSLRNKAVAVCGSTEDRHGIVLAKSEIAKKAGVKTGMVNWEAKRLCPNLILVPPQYEQYLKYSALTRAIYSRFTDLVEPFGMDECWLDVSGSRTMYGNEMEIAETIRQTVKQELGLTVSIGVSFNKIFAKLGSDMKKPDAITEITEENYRDKVWPLPASEMIYVGRATEKKLASYGVHTIGQLAALPPETLKGWFGVNGLALWSYASGADSSRVASKDFVSPVKSIGHGITCVADLENEEEVWKVMLELSQDIGHKLRVHQLVAGGVQITVKNNELNYKQYQTPFSIATRSPMIIAEKARELFTARYDWRIPVRAVTVRAINLLPQGQPQQMDIFTDSARLDRLDKLETAVEDIRRRFGKRAIHSAALMGDLKMPGRGMHEIIMPGMMAR